MKDNRKRNLVVARPALIGLGLLVAGSASARLEICNETDLILLVAVGYHTAIPMVEDADELEGWVYHPESEDTVDAVEEMAVGTNEIVTEEAAGPVEPAEPLGWAYHSVGRIATQGWWKIYPGFCETPVDLTLMTASYWVHAEADPRTTVPTDTFTWGEEGMFCVQRADFRIPHNAQCPQPGSLLVGFQKILKTWNNENRISIFHPARVYRDFASELGVEPLADDAETEDAAAEEVADGSTDETGEEDVESTQGRIEVTESSEDDMLKVQIAGIQRLLYLLGYNPGSVDGLLSSATFAEMNRSAANHQLIGFDTKGMIFIIEDEIVGKQ